jgi:hypothetical protein
MEEKLVICPRCGGNALYVQKISEDVNTYFDFGCGFTTSTIMVEGTKPVLDALETSPELYKDLMFIDDDKKAWFPATVTLPEKGMVFLDGTSKDNWKWSAVQAIEITEEEKSKYPEGQTHKMDTKNTQMFDKKDFMDALDAIKFFDVLVAEQE